MMPSLGWRRAIVALRIAAIVGWFALIIVPHLLLALVGRRDVVPPPFLAGVGWLAGLRVRRVGRPADGKLLMIANHLSWLDILALAGTARAAFVAHGGLAGHGLLKWLCEQNDTVFVARERRGAVSRQVRQVEQALARRRMVIFPEGTTGDGSSLRTFKSALFSAVERAGESGTMAVQPVALDYDDRIVVAWGDNEPGMHNVMRILARLRPIRLTVRFLEPMAGEHLSDRKTMARVANDRVAAALRLQIPARMQ